MNDELKQPTEVDEIDALLNEYNEGLKVNESDYTNTEAEETIEPSAPIESSTPIDWRGNPAYYQKGQKAGQLRPSMKRFGNPPDKMELQGSSLIDGALFIMLIDMLFPLIITALNNKLTKSKIKLEDLQLNDKQKKDLSPIADEVVKKMSLSMNPIYLLLIAMSGIYGINYMAAKSAADLETKKK